MVFSTSLSLVLQSLAAKQIWCLTGWLQRATRGGRNHLEHKGEMSSEILTLSLAFTA